METELEVETYSIDVAEGRPKADEKSAAFCGRCCCRLV